MERGEIRLKNETVAVYPNYLISRGFPFPPGRVKSPSDVCVRTAAGRCLPSAGEVLQRRRDGSIEWMRLDFLTHFGAEERQSVFVEMTPGDAPAPDHPVVVEEGPEGIRLGNGLTELIIGRSGSLIRRLTMWGREWIGAGDRVDLEAVDLDGKMYRPRSELDIR